MDGICSLSLVLTSNVIYIVDSREISNPAEATTFEVYGAQVEEGSYATSYIPTYGSAVTRNTEPNAMDKKI